MTPPLQLILGPPRHGVTRYAAELAAATGDAGLRVPRLTPDLAALVAGRPVHLHLTDALLGPSSDQEESIESLHRLTRAVPTTITLHDAPQPTDGTRRFPRRVGAYRRLVQGCAAVACNSRHERHALRAAGVAADAHVVPLPVAAPVAPIEPAPARAATGAASLGLLGFVYPGKGHEDLLRVAARIARSTGRTPPTVVALGAEADGHASDTRHLRLLSRHLAVPFEITGYLDEEQLAARMDAVTVPVSAHRQMSASGSINSWVARGRKPVVTTHRYTREMAALRPGTLTLAPRRRLVEVVHGALEHPASTWRSPRTTTRPDLDDVAAAYLAWWRREIPERSGTCS